MSWPRTIFVLIGSWLALGGLAAFVGGLFSLVGVVFGDLALAVPLGGMGGGVISYVLSGVVLHYAHLLPAPTD